MTTNQANIQSNCRIIQKNNLTYTSCAQSIAKFIYSNEPFDFVLLQEATNWQTLTKLSSTLTKMKYISHKPGIESIVTFYDGAKYQLDDNHHILSGWMSGRNRPFLIIFFNNNLCVINLHADHHGDIYHFDAYLKETLENDLNASIYLHKLRTYHIIMAGDFNNNLSGKKYFTILKDGFFGINGGRQLLGINKEASCCDNTLRATTSNRIFDHILTNFGSIKSKVFYVHNASDHMPIIATIDQNGSGQRRIGYDFDGVIHTHVGLPDVDGQRHALTDGHINPKYQFDPIINQIKHELDSGHKIYIITARDDLSLPIIKDFLSKSILANDIDKITIYFSVNRDKSEIISNLQLDEFYDDSCLRINELQKAANDGKLPNLKNIYFVHPEKMSWIKATNDNVQDSCGLFANRKEIKLIAGQLNALVDRAKINGDYTIATANKIIQLESKLKSLMAKI